MQQQFSMCFVTAPSGEVATRIASDLVTRRLVACCNIVPGVSSVYEWKGVINVDAEVLMLMKTQTALVPEVVAAVKAQHPYELPEVISTPLGAGSAEYLAWVAANTTPRHPVASAAAADGGASSGTP